MTTQSSHPSSSVKDTQSPPPMPPEAQLYQLGLGFMVTAALNAVIKADVAEQLKSGAKPVAELAKAARVNEDALYRVLRALASVGVFAETAPRTFAHTPLSEPLRRDAGPLRGMLEFLTGPLHFRVYEHFDHAVRTGETLCQPALGVPMIWDYFAANAPEARVFDDAMTAFSAAVIPAVLATYDFSGINTLVDVAGGHGF